MGSQLARTAVILHGSSLDSSARSLLMWVCLHARDEDREPTYWAGRDVMALGLGYPDPSTNTARVGVKRALRVLVSRGLLTPLVDARAGVRQSYRITLWKTPRLEVLEGGAEGPPGGTQAYPSGGTQAYPSGGTQAYPSGGTQAYPLPKEPKEPTRDTTAVESVSTALGASAPVDNPRAHLGRGVLESGGDVALCGRGHGLVDPSCPACLEAGEA